MSFPPLYAIVDTGVSRRAGLDPLDVARAFLRGGARLVQVRAKDASGAACLALCDAILGEARRAGAQVIVNDRVDVAWLSGADGAHVGQDDLPAADARRLLGGSAIVGLSTHSESQIRAAREEPVDYVAVGPVFETRTKNAAPPGVGLGLISRARELCGPLPVVAIGGITLERAPAVLAAGATAVAVVSDLLAGDPEARVRAYLSAL